MIKGALRRLFLCASVFLLLAAAACRAPGDAGSAAAATCAAPALSESHRVRYVYDGDTVLLDDGRKLRLLGIDTPELGRDERPAQPYAQAARDYLQQILHQHDNRIALIFDNETQDRYQRSLAHAFFSNGDNVQAALLAAGFAVAYTTPPNNRYSQCYRAQESSARRASRELWSHARYRDQAVTELRDEASGFHLVHAQVLRSNRSSKGHWLNLEGGLAVQIKTEDLTYFSPDSLAALPGKTIQLRGWLHPRRHNDDNRFYLQLRHPDNLLVLPVRMNSNLQSAK